jgi:crotonobetaine/carnitine-CoA ligase
MQPELPPADVLESYPPHADTIPTLLASRAAARPEHPALEFEGRVWSYAALDEVSTWLALGAARRNVNKGDRIALVSVNTDLSVIIYLAAAKVGALFVPLNPSATDKDLEYMLAHSRASVVICLPEDLERMRTIVDGIDNGPVRVIDLTELGLGSPDAATLSASIQRLAASSEEVELPEITPDDPVVVIYTSGTTGFPKGVVHTHRNYVLAGEAFVARLHLQPDERLLALLPFFHINALFYSLGGALACGGTLITARKFSASVFWNFAAESRATQFNFLAAVGSILMKRARSEFNAAHRIRKMYGAPITAEMLRVFNEEFQVPYVIEGYGMTEIPGAACNPFLGPHKLASIGVAAVHPRFPGNFSALRVEDESGGEPPLGEVGELLVQTPIAFKEYLNDPEQTATAFRDGWFLTGDLVRKDSDDYFYFVARKKDIIRRRGENISGAELDRVVSSHPGVLEAAAIGVPSELGEEEILVVIVPKPGFQIQVGELLAFCREHLAEIKMPRYIAFAESLPHTPSHRVAKHRLKAEADLLANAVDTASR